MSKKKEKLPRTMNKLTSAGLCFTKLTAPTAPRIKTAMTIFVFVGC